MFEKIIYVRKSFYNGECVYLTKDSSSDMIYLIAFLRLSELRECGSEGEERRRYCAAAKEKYTTKLIRKSN